MENKYDKEEEIKEEEKEVKEEQSNEGSDEDSEEETVETDSEEDEDPIEASLRFLMSGYKGPDLDKAAEQVKIIRAAFGNKKKAEDEEASYEKSKQAFMDELFHNVVGNDKKSDSAVKKNPVDDMISQQISDIAHDSKVESIELKFVNAEGKKLSVDKKEG